MNAIILILLSVVVVLSIIGFRIYFSKNTKKLLNQPQNADYIFVKKYKSVDIHKHRPWFYRTAIVLAISSTLVAFNLKSKTVLVAEEPPISVPYGITIIPPTQHKAPEKKAIPKPEPEVVTYEEVEEEIPEEVEEEVKEKTTEVPIEATIETVLEEEGTVEEEVEDPIVDEPDIFDIVEIMPQFPGCEDALFKYLGKNIEYPALARSEQREGIVYLTFVVLEDGKVSDVKITYDIGLGCGKEAKRVVKNMPNWLPGEQRGRKVKVRYNLPVRYKLKG